MAANFVYEGEVKSQKVRDFFIYVYTQLVPSSEKISL